MPGGTNLPATTERDTMTTSTLTDRQIAALATEAAAAGDSEMVTTCDLALEGDDDAREMVCEAINAAEAMNDDDNGHNY